MEYLTFALAKGRLAKKSMILLENMGIVCNEMKDESRKLIFTDEKAKCKFFLAKATDVPTYVEYGSADIGIVGKDTILEEDKNIYEVLDLGIGKCKIAIAGKIGKKEEFEKATNLKIATKYPKITKDYFQNKKQKSVEIIKLNGSVELGTIVGLADIIVDIVETGSTLRENGLEVFEDIADISARVVVNKVSIRTEHERIYNIINNIRGSDR